MRLWACLYWQKYLFLYDSFCRHHEYLPSNFLYLNYYRWRQEINRTINGIKRDFAITKDTMVLLSGSAGEILNLDKFIGGTLGLNTSYLNPIRNLAISPNENERDSIPFHPTLLTTAIGSALNYPDTVNVLPVTIKQNEMFRWANRISVPAAALLLLMLISITGSAKSDLDSINSEILTEYSSRLRFLNSS